MLRRYKVECYIKGEEDAVAHGKLKAAPESSLIWFYKL